MNYLLNTCVLSELMRPDPDRDVLGWFDNIPEYSIHVSLFSIAEIRHGIMRLPLSRRRDDLAEALEAYVLRPFSDRFVSWNLHATEIWAKLYAEGESKGRSPSLPDSIIAATALAHGMVMVTRNVKDFQFAGLQVVNPFTT